MNSDFKTSSFDTNASSYERISGLQGTAGDKLIELAEVQSNDKILDIGCGPGHLTKKLGGKTKNKVIAVDNSIGMIEEANRESKESHIQYIFEGFENFYTSEKFNLLYCNSVLHWLKDANAVIAKMYNLLEQDGRVALQAPIKNWLPIMVDGIDFVCNHAKIKPFMKFYNNPWFHLESGEEYADLFRRNNFHVYFYKVIPTKKTMDVKTTMDFFESAPATAYLNQDHYSITITDEYCENFRSLLCQYFEDHAEEESLPIVMNRLYLLAKKV